MYAASHSKSIIGRLLQCQNISIQGHSKSAEIVMLIEGRLLKQKGGSNWGVCIPTHLIGIGLKIHAGNLQMFDYKGPCHLLVR